MTLRTSPSRTVIVVEAPEAPRKVAIRGPSRSCTAGFLRQIRERHRGLALEGGLDPLERLLQSGDARDGEAHLAAAVPREHVLQPHHLLCTARTDEPQLVAVVEGVTFEEPITEHSYARYLGHTRPLHRGAHPFGAGP